MSQEKWIPNHREPAFSLIEMVTVIAVLTILLTAGAGLIHGTGLQARKTSTDLLAGMIEQARTAAISSRSYVVLAIAEPGDLPSDGGRCQLGLFKVDAWPELPAAPANGVLISRWRSLESGIALIGGTVDGVGNPMDGEELTICYGTSRRLTVKVHAIAFNPRGGLQYPAGSAPVTVRIAEGSYRGGLAVPYQRGASGSIAENRLKIGRVVARPYHIDG